MITKQNRFLYLPKHFSSTLLALLKDCFGIAIWSELEVSQLLVVDFSRQLNNLYHCIIKLFREFLFIPFIDEFSNILLCVFKTGSLGVAIGTDLVIAILGFPIKFVNYQI